MVISPSHFLKIITSSLSDNEDGILPDGYEEYDRESFFRKVFSVELNNN